MTAVSLVSPTVSDSGQSRVNKPYTVLKRINEQKLKAL